jgi:hypothetical protein
MSDALSDAKRYRLESELLEKKAQIIELGEEVRRIELRLNTPEPEAETMSDQVLGILSINPGGLTLDEIADQLGRTRDSVRHTLRNCGEEVVSERLPGTRGKMLYRSATESRVNLEEWESLIHD